MKPIYLASPYSHPDPAVREERYQAVFRATVELWKRGFPVYSPIVYSHPLAVAGNIGTGWATWDMFDRYMIKACSGFWILKLDGWSESVGVGAEVQDALSLGRTIELLDAETLELSFASFEEAVEVSTHT